jgi:hypothetical protein
MNDRDRLEQLRALLVRLERMPASAERDWMLGEVRARAVDVETGETSVAMRAPAGDGAEPEPPAAPPRRPRRRPPSRRPAARAAWDAPRFRAATPAPSHERVVDLLEQGGVLCLDDQPAVTDGASRPWSRGLRA